MIKTEDPIKLYSDRKVVKNTVYNLLGYSIPLIVALAFIPFLIKGLGDERFGILSLAWVIIGYFSFFDFGIGRTLTKIVAEKIGLNQTDEIPKIFWTSLFLMLIISLLGSLILIYFTPTLVTNYFKISTSLQRESIYTFYALALSIPIVTTTAGLRGVLEAYQKFGIINIIRITLGVFTFLGPLLCLIFTKSLLWIVIVLIMLRVIIWILYLIQCLKINKNIKDKFKFEFRLIKPIIILSGWMTVSNVVGPLITYLDRFLIGALISVAAVTYYSTPYEVVTKLYIIPTALVAVLFPAFSATISLQPNIAKNLYIKGNKFIFLFLYPLVLLIVTFSNEAMNLWLGQKFAIESSLVLQLLSIGVLLNSLTYLPFTFLQGIGRPDIPAKINLAELPFYVLAMWFAIGQKGINGAALVFLLLFLVNTVVQFFVTHRILGTKFKFNYRIILFLFLAIALIFPFFIKLFYLKILLFIGVLLFFGIVSMKFVLLDEEKVFIASVFKSIKLSFLRFNRQSAS